MTETARQLVDKRLAHMDAEWNVYEPEARELRDNFLPGRGRFTGETEQQRRKVVLPNNAPLIAARTLGSGLHAGLTSPARPWLKSDIEDTDLKEWGPVKEWLSEADRQMLRHFAKSNLYTELPKMYAEYGTFGPMAALMFEGRQNLFRFEQYTVGQYRLAKNDEGVYDTLYRRFLMTVRQMAMRFGEKNLPPAAKRMWDSPSQRENKREILHTVEPDGNGEWKSCYWDHAEREGGREGLLKRARFPYNPILAASWESVHGDTYACSCPGMIARGDAKALQVAERDKARAIQRHHNPPMQGPANLRGSGISLAPGAMNYVDMMQATGQNGFIRPVHDFRPDVAGLSADIRDLEQRVNTAYFADLFLMLTLDERAQRATAEEIRAKYDEKVLVLGPTLEQANGMLRQLHSGAFEVMVRQSRPIWEGRLDGTPLLPPPPKELEGVEVMPEFISALQMAQRAQKLQGIERYATFAGSMAQFLGKAPEKFDPDQALDLYAEALGVDPSMVRDDATVAQMRADQAQQQQMEQMAAIAPALKQGADAMAGLASTQPVEGNILSALAGGV
jgi:hypothetical protein